MSDLFVMDGSTAGELFDIYCGKDRRAHRWKPRDVGEWLHSHCAIDVDARPNDGIDARGECTLLLALTRGDVAHAVSMLVESETRGVAASRPRSRAGSPRPQ